MSRISRWFAPSTVVRAHCDLPCGIYDPEQARIEAESCHKINEKYAANTDATFRTRAVAIKEERAELVKHHLHELFWNATKQVSKVKASTDAADSQKLLDLIDEVDAAWKATGGNDKTRVAGRPA